MFDIDVDNIGMVSQFDFVDAGTLLDDDVWVDEAAWREECRQKRRRVQRLLRKYDLVVAINH